MKILFEQSEILITTLNDLVQFKSRGMWKPILKKP